MDADVPAVIDVEVPETKLVWPVEAVILTSLLAVTIND